ncbi:prophage tail fiber N-terminal domain-containing protein [Serratia grimesii]|uniref:prophage tail fiber N-terminal domain-containing protein n=1 Tax=Serratia grimesii TaxID=82995 RepID=UPI00217B45B5|nr:prophage tail fiber N-terminal domain-containing protein [Serratia grimesii]CAI0760418.1 Prophage tail fibre N-terminal [Serratia grimesii]
MAVLISGKLIGPNGDPRPGVTIMLTAVKTSSAVVRLAPSISTTGIDGSYSLSVEVGTHNVMIEAHGRPFEKAGQITVYGDSKPGTLNDFLNSPGQDELTPAIVAMVDEMRAAAAVYAEIASDAAIRAKVSEENAQNIADANTYYTSPTDPDGTIAGIAGTPDGKSFRVGLGVGKGFKTYMNANGVAVEIGESAGAEDVRDVKERIKDDKNGLAFTFQDGTGAVFFDGGNKGGFGTPEARLESDHLFNDSFEIKPNKLGALAIQDEQGAIEVLSASFSSSNGVTPETPRNSLLERDNKNKLASLARQSKQLSFDIAGCIWDYCVILMYGQSLASAMEAWRALTLTPREPGNLLMVGQSVRGRSRTGPYVPLGSNTFTDLKAVVQSTDEPTVVLTADQIASLSPGNLSEGEGFDVGAVHFWRALQLQLKGLPSNPNRKIVLVNCAVAGRSIEELSKGASTGHYDNRVIPALQNIKSLVNTASPGATCGLMACMYIGCEWNYLGTRGTTDKDECKALVGKLFDDLTTDANTGPGSIFNVPERPLFITTQPGDVYTRDSTNLSIGTALIELSNERDNVVCAGPYYHVPSKPGGHRDPNGSRWMGQKIGQVLHNCIDRRFDWFPMQAISATYTGKEILVDHLVMRYPMVFRDTFSTITPTMYSNKGFRVQDALGDQNVTLVRIAADTIVGMTVSRELVPPVYVWYAGEAIYQGDGNLFDSDSTLSLYKYEYKENSGQYPEANIPTYVGKPYPLNNACSAYKIEAIKND